MTDTAPKCFLNALPRLAKTDKHVVAKFDTPGQFMRYLDKLENPFKTERDNGFFGPDTWSELVKKAEIGCPVSAEKSSALMQQLSDMKVPQKRREIVNARFGGRVSVPAYLGGSQNPVRKAQTVNTHKAPIAIVVGLAFSAMVDASSLTKRGVAIAALVRRVAAQRPVELWLSAAGKSGAGDTAVVNLVKFPTRPIDTHRLAFLLSSPGFIRRAMFTSECNATDYAAKAGGHARGGYSAHITWAGGPTYSANAASPYAQDLNDFLGKQVFFFHDVFGLNGDMGEIAQDAVAWVNKKASELGR